MRINLTMPIIKCPKCAYKFKTDKNPRSKYYSALPQCAKCGNRIKG